MTDEQINKMISENDQLRAVVFDWFEKCNDDVRSMLWMMINEQRNLHVHLNNHFQVIILIMAQLKMGELMQEYQLRKKEDI